MQACYAYSLLALLTQKATRAKVLKDFMSEIIIIIIFFISHILFSGWYLLGKDKICRMAKKETHV